MEEEARRSREVVRGIQMVYGAGNEKCARRCKVECVCCSGVSCGRKQCSVSVWCGENQMYIGMGGKGLSWWVECHLLSRTLIALE